jgi:hypothetical protein
MVVMDITFARKQLSVVAFGFLVLLVAGCGDPHQSSDPRPGPRQPATALDQRIAERIRTRTDELLFAVVRGDYRKVRGYFPPGQAIDARAEIIALLEVPPRVPFQVTTWDSKAAVTIAPDRREAAIIPPIQVKVSGTDPIYRLCRLTWVSPDKTWETFYLKPRQE